MCRVCYHHGCGSDATSIAAAAVAFASGAAAVASIAAAAALSAAALHSYCVTTAAAALYPPPNSKIIIILTLTCKLVHIRSVEVFFGNLTYNVCEDLALVVIQKLGCGCSQSPYFNKSNGLDPQYEIGTERINELGSCSNFVVVLQPERYFRFMALHTSTSSTFLIAPRMLCGCSEDIFFDDLQDAMLFLTHGNLPYLCCPSSLIWHSKWHRLRLE